MKKNYNKPEINISAFAAESVLTSSGYSEAQTALSTKGIEKENIYEINFKNLQFIY